MDPVSLAVMGGTALAGGIFGASGAGETKSSKPWKPQAKALKGLYGDTTAAYGRAAAGAPTDFYAGMDPLTGQGIAGIDNYATGAGADLAGVVGGSAAPLITAGGAGALGAAGGLFDAAVTDPTQGNIDAAIAYADNPWVQGTIDAANRDTARALFEDQLPSLERGAVAGGNINSSRTGAREAILERGANDRMADTSAAIRGDAYRTGLGLAENARVANLGALESAGGLFSRSYGQGVDAAGAGQQMAFNNFDAQVAAGQLRQADAQGEINGEIAKNQYELDLLQKRAGIIGSPTTGTTTVNGVGGVQGALQGALGGATTGLGLYGKYKQIQNPQQSSFNQYYY